MGHFKPLWALVPAIRPRFGRSKFGTSQISSRVPPYLDSASGGLGDAHASQSHNPKSHRTGHYERRKKSGGKHAVLVFPVLNNEALKGRSWAKQPNSLHLSRTALPQRR